METFKCGGVICCVGPSGLRAHKRCGSAMVCLKLKKSRPPVVVVVEVGDQDFVSKFKFQTSRGGGGLDNQQLWNYYLGNSGFIIYFYI